MTLNGGHYHYSSMCVQIRLPGLAFLTRIVIFEHVFKARKANIHEYKLIGIIDPRFMKEISETLNKNSRSFPSALCLPRQKPIREKSRFPLKKGYLSYLG